MTANANSELMSSKFFLSLSRRILLLISIAAPAHAQTVNDWLCISDQSTGFSKVTGSWRSANFKAGDKYIVKRSSREGVTWEVDNFGQPSLIPDAICKSDFTSAKILRCEGLFSEFMFNAKTGRFMHVYNGGYWTYIPGDTLMGNDSGDTPAIDIGTCSSL